MKSKFAPNYATKRQSSPTEDCLFYAFMNFSHICPTSRQRRIFLVGKSLSTTPGRTGKES